MGAKAFVVLFDQRFRDNNSQTIIGIIEIDLNQIVSLVYIAPNYTMNLSDFIQNIHLEVQTIGFGRNFVEHNLHLDITFIGRISDQISPRYRININPLVTTLSSEGIQFLPPEIFDSSRNQNNQWQTHIHAGSSRSAITTPGSAIITNRRNSLCWIKWPRNN